MDRDIAIIGISFSVNVLLLSVGVCDGCFRR